MKIAIGTHADGEHVIRLKGVLPDTDVQIDIEPNAVGEDEHLYVTIELDGETFERRLPRN